MFRPVLHRMRTEAQARELAETRTVDARAREAVAGALEQRRASDTAVSLDEHFAAARGAVERAELRRRGLVPLAPRNSLREALEDDLLRMVDEARKGRNVNARATLEPSPGRDTGDGCA